VVRDSSSKQVVMWLQEGDSEVSKALANPPWAGGANALAAANPLLATANLGVSIAGFALVLQQLNRISDQIRALEARISPLDLVVRLFNCGITYSLEKSLACDC